jgi:hypothetical protein
MPNKKEILNAILQGCIDYFAQHPDAVNEPLNLQYDSLSKNFRLAEDANSASTYTFTPVLLATKLNNQALAKYLISNNANCCSTIVSSSFNEVLNINEYNLLMLAISNRSQSLVKMLIHQNIFNNKYEDKAGFFQHKYMFLDEDGPLRTNHWVYACDTIFPAYNVLDLAVQSADATIFQCILDAHAWTKEALSTAFSYAENEPNYKIITKLFSSSVSPLLLTDNHINNSLRQEDQLRLKFIKLINDYQCHLDKRLDMVKNIDRIEENKIESKRNVIFEARSTFLRDANMRHCIEELKKGQVHYRTTSNQIGSFFTTDGYRLISRLNDLDHSWQNLQHSHRCCNLLFTV